MKPVLKDKNKVIILEDDMVQVPEPNQSDIHNHEFVGTVINLKGGAENLVTVEDGDGDCFDIEAERLEVEIEDFPHTRKVFDTPEQD